MRAGETESQMCVRHVAEQETASPGRTSSLNAYGKVGVPYWMMRFDCCLNARRLGDDACSCSKASKLGH
jgi:hypothetical protein